MGEAIIARSGGGSSGGGGAIIKSYPVAAGHSVNVGDVVDVVNGFAKTSLSDEEFPDFITTNTGLPDSNADRASCYIKDNVFVEAIHVRGDAMYLIVYKINEDDTITKGSTYTLKTHTNTQHSTNITINKLTDTRILLTYVKLGPGGENNEAFNIMVIDVNTVSLTASVTASTTSYGPYSGTHIATRIDAAVLTSNKIILIIASNSNIQVSLMTISGSTITLGTWTTIVTNQGYNVSYTPSSFVTINNTTAILLTYRRNAAGILGLYLITVELSTDGITLSTWNEFKVAENTFNLSMYSIIYDGERVIVSTFLDSSSTTYIDLYTISTVNRTFSKVGTSYTITGSYLKVTNIPNSTKFMIKVVVGSMAKYYTINRSGNSLTISDPYDGHTAIHGNYFELLYCKDKDFFYLYKINSSASIIEANRLFLFNGRYVGGYFNASKEGIAIASGTALQNVPILYEGITSVPSIQEGFEVISDGVIGYAPNNGILSAISHVFNRSNTKIFTGSYIGTGLYGLTDKNTIIFPFKPKLFIISDTYINGLSSLLTIYDNNTSYFYINVPAGSTFQGCNAQCNRNILSWFSTSNSAYQLNKSNTIYRWVAIG